VRQNPLLTWLIATVRRPSVWLLLILFLFITFLENAQLLRQTFLIHLGLTRYTTERILYLLPVIWAAFLFGWKGGAVTSLAAAACMLPRAIFSSPSREDALVEIIAVFIVGNLMSYSLGSLRRERERSAKLRAAQEELQFFLQQITRAQEEERKRIARELHDDTIQSVVVLCQQIDEMVSSVKGLPRKARTHLDELHQQANTIMREVRRLSEDLRPAVLDNLGLVSALEWLVADVEKYSGIPAKLTITGIERKYSTEVE
jgi:two-component system sensor histidine kinase DegS